MSGYKKQELSLAKRLDWLDQIPGWKRGLRSPTEDKTRMTNDAMGGLSLVKLDISGYNFKINTLFFSKAKCLYIGNKK